MVTPVRLPPGRLRLATSPALTGSPLEYNRDGRSCCLRGIHVPILDREVLTLNETVFAQSFAKCDREVLLCSARARR
jgi:hypothetical protein